MELEITTELAQSQLITEASENSLTTPVNPPSLELINITKKFGSLTALDQVSLHLKPGTFHALLGENGAGKSTLVKCVMGFYNADSGEVLIDDQPSAIGSPRDAQKYGIGMVYQHFTLVPSMTVAENLVLAKAEAATLINWTAEYKALSNFLDRAPFQVDLNMPVAQLAAGEKQKVEILKQLYLKSQILILDEPTSVLTPDEADEVLGLLRQQVTAGNLSVLIITHKFREVTAFADEVTVLRRGKLAGSGLVKELSIADMAKMMLGEERQAKEIEKIPFAAGQPLLEIVNIHAERDNGLTAVNDFNLVVNAGEIVGIAGVSGNGQRELVEVLAGQRKPTSGKVLVNGEMYQATRDEMFRHQIYSLPEEPLKNACVPQMSVAENMALRTFDRPPQVQNRWFIIKKVMRQMAAVLVGQFAIKTPSVDTPIGHLSGGNVQRTVLARELALGKPKILIAANPCFGLDFAAVESIHNQIVKARNEGVAVLLVSEDLDELLALSDRIVVMSEGKLVYESKIEDADFATIGHRMAGH